MRRFCLSLLILGLAGPTLAATCPAGLHPSATAEVFFGRDNAEESGSSAADWREFVGQEISPRFPDALVASDVFGPEGASAKGFARQPSKALFVTLTGSPDDLQRISAVRGAYRARFHEDTTLLVEQQSCVSF